MTTELEFPSNVKELCVGDDFVISGIAERNTLDGGVERISLTGGKMYATFKSDLSVADGSASLQRDSSSNPGCFNMSSSGRYTVNIPGGDMDGLTAGVLYYFDLQVVLANGALITLVRDTIRFVQDVTRATS
jgi:hypothetical protein